MKDVTIISSEEKEVLVKNVTLSLGLVNSIMEKSDKSNKDSLVINRKEFSSLVWAIKGLSEIILNTENHIE